MQLSRTQAMVSALALILMLCLLRSNESQVIVPAFFHSGLAMASFERSHVHRVTCTVVLQRAPMDGTPYISSKRGEQALFQVFLHFTTFNHERAPCHVQSDSMPSKQMIRRTVMNNEPPASSKSGPDDTQHSEWPFVTVSMVQLAVGTALDMSVYTKLPCNKPSIKYNTLTLDICTVLVAVLLKLHKYTPLAT